MLTAPITTPYFNLRVLNMVTEHFTKLGPVTGALAAPTVTSLSALDTNLAPGETMAQILGVVSPWIDLCSPDPVIYNVSRQVLVMEVAYAAFCGIGNLILPCPKLHHGKTTGTGIAQYAHAVQQVLDVGGFIHMSVTMPIMDNPHDVVEETKGSLALHARPEHVGVSENERQSNQDTKVSLESHPEDLLDIRPRKSVHVSSKHDYFGTWDAWNVIRTVCRYNSRLFVGKNIMISLASLDHLLRALFHVFFILESTFKAFFRVTGYPVGVDFAYVLSKINIRDMLIIPDSAYDTPLPPPRLGLF